MRLDQLTLDQCELVRQWRNDPLVLPMLRTREPLTVEQQEAFYRDVICNPASNHRYYALVETAFKALPIGRTGLEIVGRDVFVGMGGLTYLDRVPGEGEISLILGPEFRRGGLGTQAVSDLRAEAARLGLTWVVGECYYSNPARLFWLKQAIRRNADIRYEPDRILFRMRVS